MSDAAFIHKPRKQLQHGVFVHPTATKPLWDRIWVEARRQPWFQDDLGYVGNDGKGHYYFQKNGLTTGFAMVTVGEGEAR